MNDVCLKKKQEIDNTKVFVYAGDVMIWANNKIELEENLNRWHNQFATAGCLCKGKSVGRPRVSEENVQRVWNSFLRNPKKSVRKASRERGLPMMTVWKVLRKRLHMRPYRLQMLQALKPIDCAVRSNFALEILQQRKIMTFLIVLCSVKNQHFI